jgi:hypothetical protein
MEMRNTRLLIPKSLVPIEVDRRVPLGNLLNVGRCMRERSVIPDAEGATAPETLRQKDRAQTALWKAAAGLSAAHRRGRPAHCG